jgi:hypothetical protein
MMEQLLLVEYEKHTIAIGLKFAGCFFTVALEIFVFLQLAVV